MTSALGGTSRSAKRLAIGLGVVLLTAACGRVGELTPPPGHRLPIKPKLAAATPTPTELLTPPTYGRPGNVEELLRRSTVRRVDRFDLPPPDGGDAPVAETNGQAESQVNSTGPSNPK